MRGSPVLVCLYAKTIFSDYIYVEFGNRDSTFISFLVEASALISIPMIHLHVSSSL